MAELHPIVVHVTIVLAIVGVGFRLLSLLGRPAFAGPAAATLLIIAAATSVVSVRSGVAAHGPVERVPGARPAVVEHEEWGERAQMILIALGLLELAGLALRRSPKVRLVHGAAAVVGLAAVFAVYEAGEHGGELVYSYAGGVGIRSGEPEDIGRLLLAGYYHQAQADRAAGRLAAAADLVAEAARRFPNEPEVQLMAGESLLVDSKDAQAAIDTLSRVRVPADNRFAAFQRASLLADAYEAAGQHDQAVATLEAQLAAGPNPRLQQRLDALKGGTR